MKNPWLSLWMSGANAWAGSARGLFAAEMQRHQSAMMEEATRQMMAFWFPPALFGGQAPARVKRTRK